MILRANFNSNLLKEEEIQKRISYFSDGKIFARKLAILTTADNISNKWQLQGKTQSSQISQLQKRIYLQSNRARIIYGEREKETTTEGTYINSHLDILTQTS